VAGTEQASYQVDFSPSEYARIRRAGDAAYDSLYAALEREGELEQRIDLSSGSSASQTAAPGEGVRLGDVLPLSPAGPLPLRTLVCLGGNAIAGELERFYNEPQLAGVPASEQLRLWYRAYSDDFGRFFPEYRFTGFPDEVDWIDGGEDVWQQLSRISTRFAAARDRPAGASEALFVLLRDEAESLAGMAESLKLNLNALTRSAFEDRSDSSSLGLVSDRYEAVRERLDAPEGFTLAFAALLIFGRTRLGETLLAEYDEKAILDAVVSGSSPERSIFNLNKRAVPDRPTAEDRLGMAPLVEGLRALLDDDDTHLPLAVGINAPWGAGKSSVMLQLRNSLEAGSNRRTWIPVRFDAWKFERSERLWAALAKAIYEQSEEAWSWWGWLGFKVRLEKSRRGKADSRLRLGLLVALGCAVVLIALLQGLGVPLLLGTALFAGGAADTFGRSWGLVGDPFKRAIDTYTRQPTYKEHLGFTNEAAEDVRAMTEELTAAPNRALVVFVDDLDRCSPRHIVDVVEAINQIFNSNERAECAFILGMDTDMVAAGIEVAYRETIEALPERRKHNFGLAFLAKLVQISVTVPSPAAGDMERFLTSMAGWKAGKARPAKEEVRSLRERLAQSGPANPVDVHVEAERIRDTEPLSKSELTALEEAVRLERAELFDRDSYDVETAEQYLLRYLDRNPREVKRFDNAFRLQLHVANGTPGCDLAFDLDDLIVLGKWIVLRLHWPKLGDALDRDPDLLAKLERESNPEAASLKMGSVWEKGWGDARMLRAMLKDSPSRRLARLGARSYLRVS
jgi:hypothetical protein